MAYNRVTSEGSAMPKIAVSPRAIPVEHIGILNRTALRQTIG